MPINNELLHSSYLTQDQKVSWHATPFEVRLEKALSEEGGLSLFPRRYLTVKLNNIST